MGTLPRVSRDVFKPLFLLPAATPAMAFKEHLAAIGILNVPLPALSSRRYPVTCHSVSRAHICLILHFEIF